MHVRHLILVAIVVAEYLLAQVQHFVVDALAHFFQRLLHVLGRREVRHQRMHVDVVGAPVVRIFLLCLVDLLLELLLLIDKVVLDHFDVLDHGVHVVQLARKSVLLRFKLVKLLVHFI